MRTTLALALALATTPAFAGQKSTNYVRVVVNSDGSGEMTGSIGDARASSDGVQFIGCTFTGSTIASGYCYAIQADGHGDYCLLNSAAQLQAVALVGPSSFLDIGWDKNNSCTYVRVDNYSYNRPVTP